MSERYMRAYYHEFNPTGVDAVDAILEAIATAGRAYHNTSEWDEDAEEGDGLSFWDRIQKAADEAAALIPAPPPGDAEARDETRHNGETE